MRENRQQRCIAEIRAWGREAGFSATAAKCAAFGRNDDFGIGVRR
jgi:hypothetical protein